jgi:hypothetical protein
MGDAGAAVSELAHGIRLAHGIEDLAGSFQHLDSLAEADPVLDVAIVLSHLTIATLISPLPRDRAREVAWVLVEEYFTYVPEP